MRAKLLKAGPMTLLQDLGRTHVGHLGITQGGALDEHAFLWANKLLNNPANSAQIEINLGPLVLEFNQQTTIAICGADMDAKLNNRPLNNWASHRICSGDRLTLRGAKQGVRSYIAVKGGWQAAPVFNALSTVPREKSGYILTSGDTLDYQLTPKQRLCYVPQCFVPNYQLPATLKLIPGYQFNQFSSQAIETLLTQPYKITPHYDRMGVKLSGQPITTPGEQFTSEGIALGALQIPADGQPIILLKDRQTIGGYPKPGCIALCDLNILAQRPPGSLLHFTLSSLKNECQRRTHFLQFFGLTP